MPLVKRTIEPKHLCRGALPDGVTNELECVTNSTLAAIIKQLGGLSRHAEDIFGELFNEANSFYMRMNSLQERVDLLAVKVTQLDSTVEEVSLQDINMRKAFKSSTIQDQQVVSRNSIPNPVMEVYQRCDKPPPLNILTPYRDDKKDGLKFYTDPSYFFNLWKEKMLQATENKRKEKRRQKQEQKHTEDPTREVKKVRKARNRRQEWNMMAYDKEFRPDTRLTPSPYHGMSSEGSLSPDRSGMSDEHSYPASPNHPQEVGGVGPDGKDGGPTQTQSLDRAYRPAVSSSAASARQHSLGRVQPHHGPPPADSSLNGPRPAAAKDYSGHQMHEHFIPPAPPPPPPLIPSSQTAFDSTSGPPSLAPGTMASLRPYSPSPPPAPPSGYTASPAHAVMGGPPVAPPPPPPGPPTHAPSPSRAAHPSGDSTLQRKGPVPLIPMSDARSDLLAAIRRGIQLRKVQEQREQEAKKEPVGNDVATILSRRIAVEYSESDEDSEPEENEWSD
ncbi:actin-binding protein WASF3 [Danio rerio]|uniref:Wiskott-Aldrich syndrome protein family member n=2 Tax=Danio rerio TaxID=7955 RepID=I3ITM8_DANRE|nr:wiskott-Aldrich syndrome protein family member 3-like [Danio rerio]|eukprot:XP_003200954.1 wiskott-Aldrich syndrome protein family member 3-like [Danio rerio]